MKTTASDQATARHSVVEPASHSLHICDSPAAFCREFAAVAGSSVSAVVDQYVVPGAARAVFLTGSIPLGMATQGSDVDLVVLVDSKDALIRSLGQRNTDQRLTFLNDNDALKAALFITVMNGVTVEVAVAITPAIKQIYSRLRSKGPELNDTEVMTLGRLSAGWLLESSEQYLERHGVSFRDPPLAIYCSTRSFSFSIIYRLKAARALDLQDFAQALHLGRLSVEMAYLAYFASEGLSYLGPKWLALVGHARGAKERLERHPLLREGIPLLFPQLVSDTSEATRYLAAASQFIDSMRALIEKRTLFRIAFSACPQIAPAS